MGTRRQRELKKESAGRRGQQWRGQGVTSQCVLVPGFNAFPGALRLDPLQASASTNRHGTIERCTDTVSRVTAVNA